VNINEGAGHDTHKLGQGCRKWHKKHSRGEKDKTVFGEGFENGEIPVEKDTVKIEKDIIKKIVNLEVELIHTDGGICETVMHWEAYYGQNDRGEDRVLNSLELDYWCPLT
jgi:hypothetical protein